MVFRGDLDAAHARIAALELELRVLRDGGGATVGPELASLRAENDRLRAELQRRTEEARELLAKRTAAEVDAAQLRGERDRLLARVQLLQQQRAKASPAPTAAAARPATAATATATAPVGSAAASPRPTVWEQNRRRSPSSRGEPVDAWCPTCRALGEEVQLRRNLGRFARSSGASDYESVACPRCLFTALLRR